MPKHEPAVGIGATLTAVLYGLYAVLRASGVGVTDDMTEGINALVLALCAVPAVSGAITRFFVYAPASVEKIQTAAYVAGTPPTEAKPDLPTPPATV